MPKCEERRGGTEHLLTSTDRAQPRVVGKSASYECARGAARYELSREGGRTDCDSSIWTQSVRIAELGTTTKTTSYPDLF